MSNLKRGGMAPELDSMRAWFDPPIEEPAGAPFGEEMEQAVRFFQISHDLSPDGIIGKKTRTALIAAGWRWEATEEELAVSERARVPLLILRALMKTEGGDRDPSVVRFEPHLMRRWLGARGRDEDATRVALTTSGDRTFSRVKKEVSREAFEHAFTIDPKLAVRATSWGRYQVMGSWLLKLVGGDPTSAVKTFDKNPDKVSLDLVGEWFLGNSTAARIARQRPVVYRQLARLYNGPRYAENNYHRKLERNLLEAKKELGL